MKQQLVKLVAVCLLLCMGVSLLAACNSSNDFFVSTKEATEAETDVATDADTNVDTDADTEATVETDTADTTEYS